MADSRSFDVPSNFDSERLGTELVTWLKETKHLDVQGKPLQDGFLIQAQRRGNLRDWVGIDEALQVKLIQRPGRIEVSMGVSQGLDRFKQRFPGNVLFTPLAVPAAVGAWLQKNLPGQIFDWIEQHINHKASPLFPAANAAPAKPASTSSISQGTGAPEVAVEPRAAEQLMPMRGRYFQRAGAVEDELLIQQLHPNEIILAWLAVASVTNLPDAAMLKPKVTWHYLLTTERSALMGYARDGSPVLYELPPEPLHLSGSLMRYTVAVQQFTWKTLVRNDDLYEEIALIPAADRRSRLREMSRLNWLHRDQEPDSARSSRWLLTRLTAETSNPWDCLSSAYVQLVTDHTDSENRPLDTELAGEMLGTCLARLLELENSADLLCQWAQRWGVSALHRMSVVEIALDLKPAEESALMALPLHRDMVASVSRKLKDPTRQAIVALPFARHLLQAGKHEEAVSLLEKRLFEMPDESLVDLLPPRDVDLTSGDTQIIRCRILELLAEARGGPGSSDLSTIGELARLQPLVTSRIHSLIEVSTGLLQGRARAIYKLLAANGLNSDAYETSPELVIHRLPPNLLANKLPHPAARRGGPFEWLEGWLGKTQGPDYSALKSYVERVTAARSPEAMQALTDAAKAFGIKKIEAYISRGEKEVGVRVYEGSPPFLLIGGAHLDPQSELHLMTPELRFVIACEVAHLHYHHTRLTSNELWTGVFRKGTQFLGIFGSLAAPLGYLGDAFQNIKNLKDSEILFRKAESFTGGAKKAVDFMGYAKDVQQVATSGKEKEPEPEQRGLAEDNDKLLAAFRVMQLTADRSGLVLCGDIRAAVRAIFLCSRQYQAELSRMERHGLAEVLDQRNSDGDVVNQDLAIRLAALCSFYLSNDYLRLRHALLGD